MTINLKTLPLLLTLSLHVIWIKCKHLLKLFNIRASKLPQKQSMDNFCPIENISQNSDLPSFDLTYIRINWYLKMFCNIVNAGYWLVRYLEKYTYFCPNSIKIFLSNLIILSITSAVHLQSIRTNSFKICIVSIFHF